MEMQWDNAVRIRFALPSAELKPYITTYYRTEVSDPDGFNEVLDILHPEWANLRFLEKGWADGSIGGAPMEQAPGLAVTGPTSHAGRICLRGGAGWGIGILPLGWATLFGVAASDYTDRVIDGRSDQAFAIFHSLADALDHSRAQGGDFASELAIIEEHMAGLAIEEPVNRDRIARMNEALIDPELSSVADLADRVGMTVRSLERLSKHVFGFTPKLLLRRQRFLRSLSQFMLDPSLKWLSTLDHQYHDQAHFIRDFKRFMGMSPSVYSKLHKPLVVAAAQARMEIAGEAMQGLADPKRGNA